MFKASKAAVLGGGAFGTAMAVAIARKGANVSMWVREPDVIQSINEHNENTTFLKGIKLDKQITATSDLIESTRNAVLVLLVVPTQFLRRFIVENRDKLPTSVPLVCCSKGIETKTLLTPYEILVEELPGKYHNQICVLSGPSFAKEVATGLPTSVTVASHSSEAAVFVQKYMSDPNFRVYTTDDVIGAELCGALKNVIAIASGASDGFGFGFDARAALITRGLAEMSRLVVKKGGKIATMSGLAGMGDLVLTCTGNLSRNFQVGQRLAKGEDLKSILGSSSAVAEGVPTALSVHQLAQKLQVDMPISEEVYQVLHCGKNINDALKSLQSRPLRSELEDFEHLPSKL
jgi:glycerol-3-phosphate dehydrogenase (NAD(P)+)